MFYNSNDSISNIFVNKNVEDFSEMKPLTKFQPIYTRKTLTGSVMRSVRE